jgi:large subunit ribosomal protein L21
MYAVIETGGKQYRVEVGTELEVELLDAEPGQSVTLDRVLLVGDDEETAIGRPVVENAAVEAEVLRRDRGDKVIVFKYRPKARRRVKKGHRQDHTVLRITDVRLNGKSAAAATKRAEQDAKTERQRLEEAAARQAAADAELAAKLAASKPKAAAKSETSEDAPKRSRAKASADADAADAPKPTRAKSDESTDETKSTKAEAPKARRTKKDD